MKNSISIFLIYFILSTTTLFLWESKGQNEITGDEPQYLVVTSGIVNHQTFEQTKPFVQEFKTRGIFKNGLASKDAVPSPKNSHTVAGPNGLFSVHNIGLPILISIPFIFGGVLGAKIFMIFCGACVILFAGKFASLFSRDEKYKFWSTIAVGMSLSFIPASNQIYPDILGGLLSLVGLYWFIAAKQKHWKNNEILLACVISFLPWLQIKFAATSFILILSVAIKIYLISGDSRRVLRIILIAGISSFALFLYNYYAFGKVSGPYQSGALEFSKTSLMVLVGLFFDQNQGFLFQNPINFIGILAIGWLYRFNRVFLLVWGLVFLSLIVPNALHINWYGGTSFSGRFGWAAAVVFIVPSVYGVLEVAKINKKIFYLLIAGGVLLQLYFFCEYAINDANLYNKIGSTPADEYSIYYSAIDSWLPMLYHSEWAFEYIPNYAWLVLVCLLLLMGFVSKQELINKGLFLVIILFALIFISGWGASKVADYSHQLVIRSDSKEVEFNGWSAPEVGHRWSNARKSNILFTNKETQDNFLGRLYFEGATNGNQRVEIKLNGKIIFNGNFDELIINAWDRSVKFPPSLINLGVNHLSFDLVDARSPGNGDTRLLALKLVQLRIR